METAVSDTGSIDFGDADALRFTAIESLPVLKKAGLTAVIEPVEAWIAANGDDERQALVTDLYAAYQVLSDMTGMRLPVPAPARDQSELYRYVEAPDELTTNGGGKAVFLAGGITGCPNWQQQARRLLHACDPYLVVVNPRQSNFDLSDPNAGRAQTRWEARHLHRVDGLLFWFPESQAVQPIALYELGFHLMRGVPIAVGCDPGYPRRRDVHYQLEYAVPDLVVHESLADTVSDIVGQLSD